MPKKEILLTRKTKNWTRTGRESLEGSVHLVFTPLYLSTPATRPVPHNTLFTHESCYQRDVSTSAYQELQKKERQCLESRCLSYSYRIPHLALYTSYLSISPFTPSLVSSPIFYRCTPSRSSESILSSIALLSSNAILASIAHPLLERLSSIAYPLLKSLFTIAPPFSKLPRSPRHAAARLGRPLLPRVPRRY